MSETRANPEPIGLGRIGFVGVGAAGATLARAFAAVGERVEVVFSRSPERAAAVAGSIARCRMLTSPQAVSDVSDTVFLAVPDDAIATLAADIVWRPGQAAIHLSGARGVDALAAAAAQGARTAAIHPLMTFTRQGSAALEENIPRRLAGAAWALETDDAGLDATLRALIAQLGGRVMTLTAGDRVPYHISGVLASNYVVTLLGTAVRLWEGFGADPAFALDALLPLLRGAVANLETAGLPEALSGPIARGDVRTVARHREWLRQHPEMADALLDAYTALAHLALPLAVAKGGISMEQAEALASLLGDGATSGQPGPGSTQPPDIHIRPATAADLPALTDVMTEADRYHAATLPDLFREPRDTAGTAEYLRAVLANEQARVFVAERGEDVIGCVLATVRRARDLPMLVPRVWVHVETLAVRERDRRTGAGTALMRAAEQWAREQGIERVELNVWDFNQPARALYERLGYRAASHVMVRDLT